VRYKLLFIVLPILLFALSVAVPVNLVVNFEAKEQWIPKQDISQLINKHKNIRLFQLVYWPVIKADLLKRYPMIEEVYLSFYKFPNITVEIIEKQPWVLAMIENKSQLFSSDGVLLNQDLIDFEIPNFSILVITSDTQISENNIMLPFYLNTITQIAEELDDLHLFKVDKIIFKNKNIQLINSKGLIVNIGKPIDIKKKFTKLRYFLGAKRKNIKQYEIIDIEYPKRVIIKSSK